MYCTVSTTAKTDETGILWLRLQNIKGWPYGCHYNEIYGICARSRRSPVDSQSIWPRPADITGKQNRPLVCAYTTVQWSATTVREVPSVGTQGMLPKHIVNNYISAWYFTVQCRLPWRFKPVSLDRKTELYILSDQKRSTWTWRAPFMTDYLCLPPSNQRRQTLLSHRGRDRLPEFGRTPRSSALEMRYGNPWATRTTSLLWAVSNEAPIVTPWQYDWVQTEFFASYCPAICLHSEIQTIACPLSLTKIVSVSNWGRDSCVIYIYSITNNIRLAWSRLQTLRPDEMADNLSKFEHQRNGNIYIFNKWCFLFHRHETDKRFVLVDSNLGSARTWWRIAPVHMQAWLWPCSSTLPMSWICRFLTHRVFSWSGIVI